MTNDKRFKALFKELSGTMHEALLRERVVKIMEMTIQDIQENPERWEQSFVHPSMYEQLNERVQKHLGFNQ